MSDLRKIIAITASIPLAQPPSWAVWERALIAAMNDAALPFAAKYTRPDGSLIWRDDNDDSFQSRDGADDFYESFYNWPLLYLMGGGAHLLDRAHHHWDGITAQLTRLGLVRKEYERGYDQFHQGESYIYFYFLCLADPQHPKLRERARRFAGFYLNEDPTALNYDPQQRIIRAPHNGSDGPRWGYFDDGAEIGYGWYPYMAPYGLPYEDVEGVSDYEDLKDPVLARRMGEVMQHRMGRGDVATNLIVTSLVTNAYLMTGDEKYRAWVTEYVGAWQERAARNGGLLPDNVGLSGAVGENMGGKWYGGLYGWSWPHGYYNIGMAALVGGANAFLLTRDAAWLDLPRRQIEAIHALGQTRMLGELAMSLGHHWVGMLNDHPPELPLFVVPYRHADSGWFDYQVPTPIYPIALWNLTHAPEDWARVQHLRETSHIDWRTVIPFRSKEDAGHEPPWLCYLRGENPDYPEQILAESYGQVARRMEKIRHDDADLREVSIHHWQEHNPVITEALVQLTLGAPQIIYNGGLLLCQVRYYDADAQRPGLPEDVAALVEKIEADHIVLHLVNLNLLESRTLVVQAGAFGEHRFLRAHYAERTSPYPGPVGPAGYAAPPLETRTVSLDIEDRWLEIVLPAGTEITLRLDMARFVHDPSYTQPWEVTP
ncbi:MAG: hypothetical protein KME04_17630 [Pleurocapsa minor GSE-CHR-MK-17-07R]|jgi:hypothetical protein|nr:hypothetical protein [Pleurocapsa minor GSE-CHR-MK 17-07R]